MEMPENLVETPPPRDVLGRVIRKNVLVVTLSYGIGAVAILALMFGVNAVSKMLRAGLQALERMEIASAISIGNAVLSAIGMIAVVAAGGGLIGALLISTAVSVATVPVSWVALR